MHESENSPNPSAKTERQPKRRRRKSRNGHMSRRVPTSQSSLKDNPDNNQQLIEVPVKQLEVPAVAGQWRFTDFDLPPILMQAIYELGYRYCTPIQGEALKVTLLGKDIVGKAQTGTGKTAAFLISILTYFLEESPLEQQRPGAPRALILAPTRELALQIERDAFALARFTNIHIASAVGGMDYQKQLQQFSQPVDILVATPGRLLDFFQRGDLHLNQVEILVLDEADRMMSMGFIPDVKRIIRATPKREVRQTFLFSATFSQDILNLASQWTYQAVHVEFDHDSQTAASIKQYVYIVSDKHKLNLLVNLLKQSAFEKVIVFANQKRIVKELDEQLRRVGINVGMLTGDVPQKQRIRTLEKFRLGRIAVLVATDVAGRGIHISEVSHVINYTLPEDPEDYVHRIGRTGRAGAKGVSISFVGEEDAFTLPQIETFIGEQLPAEQPPESWLTPSYESYLEKK